MSLVVMSSNGIMPELLNLPFDHTVEALIRGAAGTHWAVVRKSGSLPIGESYCRFVVYCVNAHGHCFHGDYMIPTRQAAMQRLLIRAGLAS